MPTPLIRPTTESDRDARARIVHQALVGAATNIFSPEEIDAVFAGAATMWGDWTDRRSGPAGTLVAEMDGAVVGLADLGLLGAGDGELAAFYVLPVHQGLGIGLHLWRSTLDHLRALGLRRMEIWTMARGAATHFYEARGCTRFASGRFSIGHHTEDAAGYEFPLL